MGLAVLNVSGNVALTVLGAVAVSTITAIVTARTTNSRLDKQLKAEKERTDAQLEAENARQSRQLVHDRELSDLAELRALLDETSRAVNEAMKVSAQISATWLDRENESSKKRLEDHRQRLRDASVDLFEFHQRIMLRLPRNAEVNRCLHDVQHSVSRLHGLSGDVKLSDEDADAMQEGRPGLDVADAHVAFLDSARRLIGSMLPEDLRTESSASRRP